MSQWIDRREESGYGPSRAQRRRDVVIFVMGSAVIVLLAINAALLSQKYFSAPIHAQPQKESVTTTDASDPLPAPAVITKEKSEVQLAEAPLPIEPGLSQTLVPAIRESTPPIAETGFDRNSVLNDFDNRIDDEFAIPAGLRDRAGFWFDVYTKWNENQRVIHNARMPWIVYRVVDVTSIIEAKEPRRRWMRNEKADKFVKIEADRIRLALKKVSRRKSLRKLDPYEADVVAALKPLGGSIQRQARKMIGETRVQVGQRNFFEEGLKISPRYMPEMEKIFASHGLPIELTRLPFVESSFNKLATSKDGATGIWQFMGNTGSKFMLVSNTIDERRSPFKATEGAARLLKENHMILYRSWPLALTAWNHGPGGVRKAVKAMKTTDLSKIVGRYKTKMFGFASSNFYCEFLGALHAQMYRDLIWSDIETEESLRTHVVRLPKRYRITHLMKLTGLDKDRLILHNPDLRKVVQVKGWVPKGFRFHVPGDLLTRVRKLLAQNSDPERRSARPKSS